MTDETIDFAVFLTGNSREDIEQMYYAWINFEEYTSE